MPRNNDNIIARSGPRPENFHLGLPWERLRFFSFKLLISILFLFFLFKWVNYDNLWLAFKGVSWKAMLISYSILFATEFLIGFRLKILMNPMELKVDYSRLVKIGFIVKFYGLLFPAGIGQPLMRWFKITGNKIGRLQFLFVSITEKVLFVIATFASVGIPLLLFREPGANEVRPVFLPLFFSAIVPFVVFLYFCISKKAHSWFGNFSVRVLSLFGLSSSRAMTFVTEFTLYNGKSKVLASAAAITVLIQAMIVLRIFFLFRAVEVSLPWFSTLWISSLVFMLQTFPISFAGVGVRESAFAFALELYGMNGEDGIVVGLLFLAQMFANSFLGGILEMSDKKQDFQNVSSGV